VAKLGDADDVATAFVACSNGLSGASGRHRGRGRGGPARQPTGPHGAPTAAGAAPGGASGQSQWTVVLANISVNRWAMRVTRRFMLATLQVDDTLRVDVATLRRRRIRARYGHGKER
jgi:hypothetical protein